MQPINRYKLSPITSEQGFFFVNILQTETQEPQNTYCSYYNPKKKIPSNPLVWTSLSCYVAVSTWPILGFKTMLKEH